jgi:hypothetical protein
MRHPFDPSVMVGDDRPLSADAKVDAAAPVRLGRAAGLLGDDRLHRHDQPAAALAQGHRQDARPALDDQPLQPSRILLGSELPDHRHGEMTAIWFQAHRAGGEPHPAAIPMAGLEVWESDPCALAAARLGVRPVMERLYQVGDPRCVSFLGCAAPPGRHFVLGLVPRLAKLVEVPGQRRDRRIGGASFEVGLRLAERPVVGIASRPEGLRDLGWLFEAGCLYLEHKPASDPAGRDLHPVRVRTRSASCQDTRTYVRSGIATLLAGPAAPPPGPLRVAYWPGRGSRLGGRGPGSPGSRKVRPPQGRVLANRQSGRPAGQCHREQTAERPGAPGRVARVKRCGKSAPAAG